MTPRTLFGLLMLALAMIPGGAEAQINLVVGGGGISLPLVKSAPYAIQDSFTQSFFLGFNAGAAYPASTENSGYGSVGVGAGALQSLNVINGEDTALGIWAAQYLASGINATAIGMHALGSEVTADGAVAVGDDAMRDAISYETADGNEVAVGQAALAHGNPDTSEVAIGHAALNGNSAGVLLTGSPTTGDVVSITVAASGGTPSTVTGLPISASHTVIGGDTLASIASALASTLAAEGANVSGPSYFIEATSSSFPDGAASVDFAFPGSTINGWQLTVTPSVTGSGSEVVAALAGTRSIGNVAIGYQSVLGQGAAAGLVDNTAVGTQTLLNARVTSYTVAIGYQAGMNCTTCSASVFVGAQGGQNGSNMSGNDITSVGFWSLDSLTSGSVIAQLGSRSLQALTTGTYFGALGYSVGSTCQTGSHVLLLGSGGDANCASAGESNTIHMASGAGDIFSATGTNTPSTAVSTLSGPVELTGATATLAAGEVGLPKVAASGTAPGAGNIKFEAVAGTNSGTCKLIAYAGTSTTPVTIVDNVGAGC
jgi:hypothetical protein